MDVKITKGKSNTICYFENFMIVKGCVYTARQKRRCVDKKSIVDTPGRLGASQMTGGARSNAIKSVDACLDRCERERNGMLGRYADEREI